MSEDRLRSSVFRCLLASAVQHGQVFLPVAENSAAPCDKVYPSTTDLEFPMPYPAFLDCYGRYVSPHPLQRFCSLRLQPVGKWWFCPLLPGLEGKRIAASHFAWRLNPGPAKTLGSALQSRESPSPCQRERVSARSPGFAQPNGPRDTLRRRPTPERKRADRIPPEDSNHPPG